ncbi:hypothetical protein ANO11243_079860 [Dothideomycetidae sp. 11243]|nr:hypothetical protein ANO11243_079860 [fungal sp. No.11243]
MSSINPAVLVVCVMLGGGFVVLMAAAFHRVLRRAEDRNPHSRSAEQDKYMREVRQRGFEEIASTGRRAHRARFDAGNRTRQVTDDERQGSTHHRTTHHQTGESDKKVRTLSRRSGTLPSRGWPFFAADVQGHRRNSTQDHTTPHLKRIHRASIRKPAGSPKEAPTSGNGRKHSVPKR